MSERIDRQMAFSGTGDVRPGQHFDSAALQDYLTQQLNGFSGPIKVEQFKGGQSNPTYKIINKEKSFVLRRQPPGKLLPSAHAVDREYKVIAALHKTGFPVPRPHLYCDDANIIGTKFYLMDFVDGRVFWEPHMPGLPATERAAIFDQMNVTIAQLHQIDIACAGLADFGKPVGYVKRQIERWSKQYRASETTKIPEMDRLMAWLPEAAPDSDEVSLVHGDFRLDNCIVANDAPQIIAVLDWELATIGDPLADFAYHLMQWLMPVAKTGGGVGSLLDHKGRDGIPSMEDYVAAYCQRSGRDGIANLDIYLSYNFFRLAAIFQGIGGRLRDGTAANENAAHMAAQVKPMAETAWKIARQAGA